MEVIYCQSSLSQGDSAIDYLHFWRDAASWHASVRCLMCGLSLFLSLFLSVSLSLSCSRSLALPLSVFHSFSFSLTRSCSLPRPLFLSLPLFLSPSQSDLAKDHLYFWRDPRAEILASDNSLMQQVYRFKTY